MDDALVQRWRDGDPTAATAVRNAVRSVAERVLGHPALHAALGPAPRARLRNEEQRRETTARIAGEVMRRGADAANELKVLALMSAGRLGVEALQEGRPEHEGERHLPPPLAVALVLYPDGVNPKMRAALDKHLEACPACREDLRILDRIVSSLDAVDHEVTRDDLAEEARKVDAALAQTVDLEEALRAAAREHGRPDRRPGERAAGRPGARPDARPEGAKVLPGVTPEVRPSATRALLPVALLAGLGLAWHLSRDDAPSRLGHSEAVRALADVRPPEVHRIADLPAGVQQAVGDFSRGDCRTAAGHLKVLQRQHPDELRLPLLEAGALVCAKDPRRALQVLEALEARVPAGSGAVPQRHWVAAQAWLLSGEPDPAIEALRRAELEDARHRDQARAQLARVRELISDG
jgi:hypothetical protein